jgi:hypothetical protein
VDKARISLLALALVKLLHHGVLLGLGLLLLALAVQGRLMLTFGRKLKPGANEPRYKPIKLAARSLE